ncbi:MAG: hypothetical protein ABL961_13380 [Vicinamibacterales bacterium]
MTPTFDAISTNGSVDATDGVASDVIGAPAGPRRWPAVLFLGDICGILPKAS